MGTNAARGDKVIDPDPDRGVDWKIIPLSLAYTLIGLAMVVVCALVLKLAGDGLSTADFPARVPSQNLIIERSLNPGRNECWLAKEAGGLGHVAHPFGSSSVPKGTLSSLPSLIYSKKGMLSCHFFRFAAASSSESYTFAI